jgi:hypothetical protein
MARSAGESRPLERMLLDMGRRSIRLPLPIGLLNGQRCSFRTREGYLPEPNKWFISIEDT